MTTTHTCERCGASLRGAGRYYCECSDCKMRRQHLEQCGECGNMQHFPGPRLVIQADVDPEAMRRSRSLADPDYSRDHERE